FLGHVHPDSSIAHCSALVLRTNSAVPRYDLGTACCRQEEAILPLGTPLRHHAMMVFHRAWGVHLRSDLTSDLRLAQKKLDNDIQGQVNKAPPQVHHPRRDSRTTKPSCHSACVTARRGYEV